MAEWGGVAGKEGNPKGLCGQKGGGTPGTECRWEWHGAGGAQEGLDPGTHSN